MVIAPQLGRHEMESLGQTKMFFWFLVVPVGVQMAGWLVGWLEGGREERRERTEEAVEDVAVAARLGAQ